MNALSRPKDPRSDFELAIEMYVTARMFGFTSEMVSDLVGIPFNLSELNDADSYDRLAAAIHSVGSTDREDATEGLDPEVKNDLLEHFKTELFLDDISHLSEEQVDSITRFAMAGLLMVGMTTLSGVRAATLTRSIVGITINKSGAGFVARKAAPWLLRLLGIGARIGMGPVGWALLVADLVFTLCYFIFTAKDYAEFLATGESNLDNTIESQLGTGADWADSALSTLSIGTSLVSGRLFAHSLGFFHKRSAKTAFKQASKFKNYLYDDGMDSVGEILLSSAPKGLQTGVHRVQKALAALAPTKLIALESTASFLRRATKLYVLHYITTAQQHEANAFESAKFAAGEASWGSLLDVMGRRSGFSKRIK